MHELVIDASADGPFLRQDELNAVMRQIEHCSETKTGAVIKVHAEAGAGKSRLLQELEYRMHQHDPRRLFLLGRARSNHSSTNAYHPFRRAVESLQQLPVTKRGGLRTAVRAVWDRELLADLPWVGPFLAIAESIQGGLVDPSANLTSHLDKTLIEFFKGLAKHTPVVLALDDMHWTDSSSSELLVELAETCTQIPLAIVVAYRDADIKLAAGEHPLERTLSSLSRYRLVKAEIALPPIDPTDVSQIVRGLTGGNQPTARLNTWLTRVAGGNPFFVEEYLALLNEKEAISVRTHEVDWISDEVAVEYASQSLVPMSIGEVLDARLRLTGEPNAEELLQAACILSGPFDSNIVAELGGFDQASTRWSLSRICKRSGLIRHSDDGYVFWHNLVRVHFEKSLKSDDGVTYRELHARAAGLLESRLKTTETLPMIARHLHEAREHFRAAQSCLIAAKAARAVGGLHEADLLAQWAFSHATSSAQPRLQIDAAIEHGTLSMDLRQVQTAKTALLGAVALINQHQHQDDAELFLHIAKAYRMENDWVAARDWLHAADRVVRSQDRELRARIGLLTGEIALCGQPCELKFAGEALTRALELTGDDHDLAVGILGHLALAELAEGSLESARGMLRRARRASERGSPADRFVVALFAAHIGLAILDLDGAQTEIDVMRQLADEHYIGRTDVDRYQGRVHALAGNFFGSAEAYSRFLISDLRLGRVLPEAASWVLTHVSLQVEELQLECGEPAVASFIAAMVNAVEGNAEAFGDDTKVVLELLSVLKQRNSDECRVRERQEVKEWHDANGGWNHSAEVAYDFYCTDVRALRQGTGHD